MITEIRDIFKENNIFQWTSEIEDTDSLIEKGVMDSFGIIQLVVLLEEKFKAKFGPEDMKPENFATLNAIETLLRSKASE